MANFSNGKEGCYLNVVYLVIAAVSESESEAIAFSPKAINKTSEFSV